MIFWRAPSYRQFLIEYLYGKRDILSYCGHCVYLIIKVDMDGAVIVAQLAERSLPTPEIRGLNTDIGNELFRMYICQLLSRKDKNKEKEAGNGPIKKKSWIWR